MRFRFVHAADLHLDTPFHGLARTDPQVAEQLRDASLGAWDDLVACTIAEDASFLLLAGDIYDGPERGVRAQLRFLRGLERLSEHGIPVLIVHGNHDPLQGWSAISRWPAGVTVFPAGVPTTVPVERAGVRLATVVGQSYGRRQESSNLAQGLHRGSGGGLAVGLLHTALEPQGTYAPCSSAELLASGFDYWALGHMHTAAVLHSHPPIVYPGALQGRSMAPGEQGPKGAYVVEAETEVLDLRFVALDRVRLLVAPVHIEDLEDLGALHRAVRTAEDLLVRQHGGRMLVVRLELVGRGPLHAILETPEAQIELLRDLRDGASPGIWWESLQLHTAAPIDRAARAAAQDFGAELIAETERLLSDPALLVQLWEEAAGDARSVLGSAPPSLEVLRQALREADALCLERLDSEG